MLESKLEQLPAMGLNALKLPVAFRRLIVNFAVTVGFGRFGVQINKF